MSLLQNAPIYYAVYCYKNNCFEIFEANDLFLGIKDFIDQNVLFDLKLKVLNNYDSLQIEYFVKEKSIWFSISAYTPKNDTVVVVLNDITKYKIEELKERELKDTYQTTLEAIPDLMFEITASGVIINYHAPENVLLYTSPNNFLGKNVCDVLPYDAYSTVFDAISACTKREQASGFVYMLSSSQNSSEKMWFEISIAKKRGAFLEDRFVALIRDITTHKKTEQKLINLLLQNQTLLNVPYVGALMFSPSGECLNVNETILKWTEFNISVPCSHSIDDLFVGNSVFVKNKFFEVLKTRKEERFEQKLQTRFCDVVINPILNTDGTIAQIVIFLFDITAKKKNEEEKNQMQAQLLLSSRLASIGQMAAGIGHEINNPLTILTGYLERLTDYLPPKDDVFSIIDKMHDAGDRIKNIVDGLRTYARSDSDTIESIDVHEVIKKSVKLVQSIYQKEGVNVTLLLHAVNFKVMANYCKLQQVLMNLLSNAKDAISTPSGNITIETFNESTSNIVFKVIDDGAGISSANLDKVFDAFYTTKKVGKGTGLGLNLVHAIITSFGGEISVKSKEGVGSIFKIVIPLAPNQEAFEPKTQATCEINLSNQLYSTACVVDDEPEILMIIRDHLEELGMIVDTAENVDSAWNLLTKKEYDYLLTDLKMPGKDGAELIKRVRENNRKEKVILITGCMPEFYPSSYDVYKKIDGRLMKPFTKHDLYKVLNDSLTSTYESFKDNPLNLDI